MIGHVFYRIEDGVRVWVDEVFFLPSVSRKEALRSVVDHDGFPPDVFIEHRKRDKWGDTISKRTYYS